MMLRAMLAGNVGGDAEMRYSANGTPFLRFNVASHYTARTPDGEWQKHTEWVRVTLFGQRVEFLSQHLRRGTFVCVDGRLEARPWTDQHGQVRAGLEIVANDVEFANPRPGDEARDGDTVGGSAPRDRSGQIGPLPRQGSPSSPEVAGDGTLEDLPF
jgi:single-strand DNA-binding protein